MPSSPAAGQPSAPRVGAYAPATAHRRACAHIAPRHRTYTRLRQARERALTIAVPSCHLRSMSKTDIAVRFLVGLAITFACAAAEGQDVAPATPSKPVVVKANGKTVVCVQVTKTLTVCTER